MFAMIDDNNDHVKFHIHLIAVRYVCKIVQWLIFILYVVISLFDQKTQYIWLSIQ